MAEAIKFNWCKCNWPNCAEIQEKLARHCFEKKESHPQLGFLWIKKTHVLLRLSMSRHLKMSPDSSKIRIARHHFHPDRMSLLGNKSMTVTIDGETRVFKELDGVQGWKRIDRTLTRKEASNFGIQDDTERVGDGKDSNKFISAPIFTRDAVATVLEALTSDPSSRSGRQQRRGGPSMVELIQEKSNAIPLPRKEAPLLPPSNYLQPGSDLMATFNMSDPATWAVPPTTLASVINVEAKKHFKHDNNQLILEQSSMQQSKLLCSALFLYTKFFHCYEAIEITSPPTSTSPNKLFYLRPCNASIHPECDMFRIMKKRGRAGSGPCDKCYKEIYNREKVFGRSKNPSEQMQKHKNNRYCSKEELTLKTASIASKKKVASKAVKRARERLDLQKEKYSMKLNSSDRNLKSLFDLAVKYVDENQGTAVEALMKVVVEQMVKSDGKMSTDERQREAKALVDDILESITTWSTRCNSGAKSVRYSPRTMRIALSLFMADSKGYEQWKRSKIEPWPSISQLKKLRRQLTPEEGTFPIIFAWFKEAFQKRGLLDQPGKLIGQVLCDRLKLRSEFYLNPKTLCTQGIVVSKLSDKIELAEEVTKLFDNHDKDVDSEEDIPNEADYSCSIYVNQFRFRSTENITSTGPFYFDNGSVSGDQIWRQIKQVIMGFEMAGATIVGLGMDGGGENMRGVKLARDGNDPQPGDTWLSDDKCSFVNPADPSRRVAIVLCSTHNAKAGRNTLLNSGHKGDGTDRSDYKRDFFFEGVRFGWVSGFWRKFGTIGAHGVK